MGRGFAGAVFAGLVALCSGTVSAKVLEYPPIDVKLSPIQVGAHCWYVQGRAGVATAANEGFNANAGFVVTPAGVVVIDTLGTPALGKALLAAIGRITGQPVVRVILTHYHADHYYGLQAFKEAGADVWAQGAARGYIDTPLALARLAQRRRDLAPWVNAETRQIPADHWIGDRARFALGGLHFELTHMGPAHAPEDLVIYVAEDQVLYSGDILYAGRIPYIGQADSRHWLAAIGRLLTLKPKVMVVGHGPAATDPAQPLTLTRDYLQYLRTTMGAAVANFTDFDVAYAQTDWRRWSGYPAFKAANRTNAYNVYLQMEQEELHDDRAEAH